ncbi:MAG TPA: magnesium transporter CorA family protein [Dehalococcoidia bacterium]|nr:magnesium transporter CorA family protein [Dehalococcoidia bacterium]
MSSQQLEINPNLNIQSISCGKLTWVYLEKPANKEVEFLAENFPFHPLNLDDIVSRVQRPKLDEYEDHIFLVLHFPVFNKQSQVTVSSEINLFVAEKYIVTVHCNADIKPLAKFFKECQLDEDLRMSYMSRSSGYLLYHILDRLTNYCFPILNKLSDNIDKVEDLIFSRTVPETVREISLIRRDLISFRRVIHPQISVIEELEKEEYAFFKEDQEIYFGDIADHIRKIWDALEDNKEVVDGLADTSNWLTSHRIQEVMRVLTIITAILAPSTLIASIYGMNVGLPGGVNEDGWLTFIIILLIMLGISSGIVVYLIKRRWL